MAETSIQEASTRRDLHPVKITPRHRSGRPQQRPPGEQPQHMEKAPPPAQQEAFARARIAIESAIEKGQPTPDLGKFGLTDRQRGNAEELVQAYADHHDRGVQLLTEHTTAGILDKLALLHDITGIDITQITGEVEVNLGPWGIEITVDNATTQRLLYGDRTPATAFCAGGLAFIDKVPPIMVFNEEVHQGIDPTVFEKTKEHERQHVRYAITGQALKGQKPPRDRVHQRPYEETVTQAENQLRRERDLAFDRVKDELFAYTFNADQFPTALFFEEGNPYDYLHHQRRFWARTPYSETAKHIFGEDYQRHIVAAAAYFEDLTSPKKGNYSVAEARALLADIPLESWETTVAALLKTRNKEATITSAEQIDATLAKLPPVMLPQTAEGQTITDAVIYYNWYQERDFLATKKQPQEVTDDTERPSVEDSFINDIPLMQLNQSLYELTRATVNNALNEHRLSLTDYFARLDTYTISVQNHIHTEQDLVLAADEFLAELQAE